MLDVTILEKILQDVNSELQAIVRIVCYKPAVLRQKEIAQYKAALQEMKSEL